MARQAHEIADEEFDDDDSAPTTDEGDTSELEGESAPDQEAESEGEPLTDGTEAPEGEETPAPETDGEEPETDGEEPEAETDLEPVPDDDGEPFAELEGAVNYKGTGVFIPEGAPLERLRSSLGLATQGSEQWTRERTQLTEQIQELRSTRGAEAEVAADVLELVFKDFTAMDEDQLYEWAVNFKANQARLTQDVREKYLERREQALTKRASQRDPAVVQQEREAAVQAVDASISATLTELYKRPELSNLTKADKEKLLARANERRSQLALQATDDSMAAHGVKKGDMYLNAQQIYEWALDRAEVRDSEKLRRAVDLKNDRKLGKGKVGKAPAGGTGGRQVDAAGDGEWKPAKDRAEWLARMEAD